MMFDFRFTQNKLLPDGFVRLEMFASAFAMAAADTGAKRSRSPAPI